jgi:hypothetical protein
MTTEASHPVQLSLYIRIWLIRILALLGTVLCASLILDLSPTESDLARTRLQSGDSMVRPYLLFHYFLIYKNKISFTPPPPYRSLPRYCKERKHKPLRARSCLLGHWRMATSTRLEHGIQE